MLTATTLIVLFATVGCGGTNHAPEVFVTNRAPEGFVTRANAICEQRAKLIPDASPPTSQEELHAMFDRAAAVEHREIVALRALIAPKAMRGDFARLLALDAIAGDAAQRGHEAVLRGDIVAAKAALGVVERVNPDLIRISSKLGLTSCRENFEL